MGSMMRILGIDPGLLCTGWGVIAVDGGRLQFVDVRWQFVDGGWWQFVDVGQ